MHLPARAKRLVASLAAVVAVTAALLALPAGQTSASAAGLAGSQFIAGDIIDDAHFFVRGAMSQSQIQAFLNGQQRGCQNSSCLSLLTLPTATKAADSYCTGVYQGASSESAAAVIYKVQQACGISAKVLLVTLQKEQGLITATKPTSSALAHAMGYLCPDTAPCSAGAAGLFSQVYGAARQFQIYRLNPNSFNFRTNQQASILYAPNAACGRKSVYIRNAATAALYNYTPYTPNAAALANLTGVGDSCSAYGNRNFWRYYSEWFGAGTSPFGNVDQASVANGVATVRGWSIDPALPLAPNPVSVKMTVPSGTTTTTTVSANGSRPDVGKVYPYAAETDGTTLHGFSYTAPESARGPYSFCVTAAVAPGSASTSPATSFGCKYQWYNPGGTAPTTSRLAGIDRYGTAVAVSRASFPTPGVPTVYLATGDNFADALSAAPAAAAQGGPLLLTTSTTLPATTLAEIKRLKPAHIVVVGGPGVIPEAQITALKSATGIAPHRIYGADRYLTSQAVASIVFRTATTAFVASGLNYPDAISASAAAGAAKAPIILVQGTSTVADAQADAFFAKATTIKTVRLIGGTGAVSLAVSVGIQHTGKAATRVAGDDRYATSDAVAHTFFPKAASTYYATGTDFADALTGSVAAAHAKSPLVLTHLECLPADQAQLLLASGASSAVLLGGEGALSPQVAQLGICQQDQLARAAAAASAK